MTDAQGWTLLGLVGVFAAALVTVVLGSQQSLRGYFEARFEAIDARFEAVDARFDAVDRRLDRLERDVQSIIAHLWRGP